MTATSVYEEAEAAGLVIGNHESDLYLQDCQEAHDILWKHHWHFGRFIDQTTGERALDVPFAYEPWWDARLPRA